MRELTDSHRRGMPTRTTSLLDHAALDRLLREQAGVVARHQLASIGATRTDVRRMLARRELVEVHRKVYISHTGQPSRRQLEWAAVLACAPAALHRESALDAHGMTNDRAPTAGRRQPIHLMVDRDRRISPPAGVLIERVADPTRWVQDHRRPPRAAFDFAVLKTASTRDEAGAIALLSDAVHQGLTTAERLVGTIADLPRLRQRALLTEVLTDVAAGTRSVLERRYMREVERAHGLPAGERQLRQRTASGVVCRDVRYGEQRTLVELDGAFGHRDATDRWADLQRDLDASVADHVTLRPGWAQVLEPCRLAAIVGRVLRQRGWQQPVRPCRTGCTADGGAYGP